MCGSGRQITRHLRHVQLNTRALPRSAGRRGRLARRSQPSWGRVLVNTVKSAVPRRRGRPGPQRRRASARPWHARWHWRFATVALALAGVAVIVLWLAGGLTGTSSRAPRVPAAGAGPAIAGGRGAGPGGRLDHRSGERQRDGCVLSAHVRGAAGTGRRRRPADAAAVRGRQPAWRQRAGDLPVDQRPAGRAVRARADRELRFWR